GIEAELALGPGEALDQAQPHLPAQRVEEAARIDQRELEQRLALLDLLAAHGRRGALVVRARQAAGLEQLEREALAREVRFRADGTALREEEELLDAPAREHERAAEARALEVEQQPGEGGLLQAPAFRDVRHRCAHRGIATAP